MTAPVNLWIDLQAELEALDPGFTPENVANKDTDATLAANSDTKYPSQRAVKTYADGGLRPLGQVAINLNATGNYVAFEVPANKIAIVILPLLRTFNDSPVEPELQFMIDGTQFGDTLQFNLFAPTPGDVLRFVFDAINRLNLAPVKIVEATEGQEISFEVAVRETTVIPATCVGEVLGYLIDE